MGLACQAMVGNPVGNFKPKTMANILIQYCISVKCYVFGTSLDSLVEYLEDTLNILTLPRTSIRLL